MYIRNQQVFISLLTHLNGTQTEFTDIENAKLLLPIINLDEQTCIYNYMQHQHPQ